MTPVLQVRDLTVSFPEGKNIVDVVKGLSFNLNRSEITAVVGESGSGKSVTALSFLSLLPAQAKVKGNVILNIENESSDLLNISESKLQKLRGNRIAMVFQEPMTSLNPLKTCGSQVMEVITLHKRISVKAARKQTIEWFKKVELPSPDLMIDRYPHELSGGQKQRVMIAMAMSCNPSVLIADEPTTALDVSVQAGILRLLKKLQNEHATAIMLITHDLGLVWEVADKVLVMYKGSIVESGDTTTVLSNPGHHYTKALLACRPSANPKNKPLPVLSYKSDNTEPISNIKIIEQNILEVKDVVVEYPAKRKLFVRPSPPFRAVDDVSFTIRKGEILGLVGESGCGKSTLGKAILKLINPSSGEILLNGKDISSMSSGELRDHRKEMQVVFQDPYGSLNPRISVGNAIMEAMKVHGLHGNENSRKNRTIELLETVAMEPGHYSRFPHEFSGGQRQRICIARALATDPSFLIFDESVSALDVSVQAQVLNLINNLRQIYLFSALFISHDLSVVHYISDRIMVMKEGRIVEHGTAEQVYNNPVHQYTQQLISAIPGKTLGKTA